MRLCARLVSIMALCGLMACGGTTALPVMPGDADPQAPLFYVTDRATTATQAGVITYTPRRDAAMGFGIAKIDTESPRPELRAVRELLRFPATPLPFSQAAGVIVPDPEASRRYEAASAQMRATLGQALRATPDRDILLYVHGFNSSFENTLETTARLWQATDRQALPVAYSWPSGNPGPFGYFKDRESGEFSIFHLKETLRLLSSLPGLGRIHIVAHSRGSDVVTTALRELVIEARAAGRNPRDSLRVQTLILAAPDLDFSVVRQRLIAERFGPAFGRITVYMNPDDSALGFAQLLMAGTRFGRLSYDQLGEAEREIFRRIRNVHFINVSAVTAQSSHGYFRQNPEVLADMAKVITTGADPDSPARNLVHAEANFWRLVLARDPLRADR
jgi:esterase/lipase superfamily enzyme